MTRIAGTVQMEGVSDSEMAKIYEFKAAHENKFSWDTPAADQTEQKEPKRDVTSVVIRWTTLEGLDLLNKFLKEMENPPRAIVF